MTTIENSTYSRMQLDPRKDVFSIECKCTDPDNTTNKRVGKKCGVLPEDQVMPMKFNGISYRFNVSYRKIELTLESLREGQHAIARCEGCGMTYIFTAPALKILQQMVDGTWSCLTKEGQGFH